MTTKDRTVLRAMTEREINAWVAQLTDAIDNTARGLKKLRWERRRLLCALGQRRRWETNPASFRKLHESRRGAA